jgi:hypothetical protein
VGLKEARASLEKGMKRPVVFLIGVTGFPIQPIALSLDHNERGRRGTDVRWWVRFRDGLALLTLLKYHFACFEVLVLS